MRGNLLACLEDGQSPPSGAGWVLTTSDAHGDTLYLWPDNPGGLDTFTFLGGSQDVILLELAGAQGTTADLSSGARAARGHSVTHR